jgi:hypothetical protein
VAEEKSTRWSTYAELVDCPSPEKQQQKATQLAYFTPAATALVKYAGKITSLSVK